MTLDALLDDLARAQKEARDLRRAIDALHGIALDAIGGAALVSLAAIDAPDMAALNDGTMTQQGAHTVLWVFMMRTAAAAVIEALEDVAPVPDDHSLVRFLAQTGKLDRSAGCVMREQEILLRVVAKLGLYGFGPFAAERAGA